MADPGAMHDIVVIGSGPVGAAAALQLRAAGFDVLLLESRPALGTRAGDLRPIALSHGTRLILDRLGIGNSLAAATSIARIHVSQRGHFGRVLMTAEEARVPALGHVLDYRRVVAATDEAVVSAGIRVQYGARVVSLAHDSSSARVDYETPAGAETCLASLIVVADGNAAAAAVDLKLKEYGQGAVTARVATDMPQEHTAYERFTKDGPIALLPFEQGYALVWTTQSPRVQELCRAPPRAFLDELQAQFGERAGRFVSVSDRAAHAVSLRYAERTTSGRAILIGNSAQALHPVAGQGLNLGLRDAWELAELARRSGVRDRVLFDAYRARRRIDRAGGIAFTHGVVTLFSNDWAPLAAARGAGLAAVDCIPVLKDFVVRRMVFGARG